tara:strand:- start:122 stop:523 length:402 start_codon:yes stop_codon:yes gene_type:complete
MNKIIPILSLLFFIQCYQDPFFELTVKIKDQNSNPVSDVLVKIEIIDLNNGSVVEESIIEEYFEETTNSSGEASFSFDNKALVTARVCYQNTSSLLYCAQGHVYLEENKTQQLELMLQSSAVEHDECSYCVEF